MATCHGKWQKWPINIDIVENHPTLEWLIFGLGEDFLKKLIKRLNTNKTKDFESSNSTQNRTKDLNPANIKLRGMQLKAATLVEIWRIMCYQKGRFLVIFSYKDLVYVDQIVKIFRWL